MKQKIYTMKIRELPLILHQNGTISKDKLDMINQFVVDNDKHSFQVEFIKLNMDLSSMLFETNEALNTMELQYVVADPDNPIGKEEKYNSIW